MTQATSVRAPQNLKPWAGDCMRPDQVKKLCEHVVENILIIEKKYNKKSSFL